jgi:Ni,Fe-hydrogenase III small subunit
VAPHNIPKKKKFEKVPTGRKIMATGFCGEKGVIFGRVMPRRQHSTLSAIPEV